jgi:hypothetical protein
MAAKFSALIIFYRYFSRFFIRSVNILKPKRSSLSLILIPYINFVGVCPINVLNKLLALKVIPSKNFIYCISKYIVKRNRKTISTV